MIYPKTCNYCGAEFDYNESLEEAALCPKCTNAKQALGDYRQSKGLTIKDVKEALGNRFLIIKVGE